MKAVSRFMSAGVLTAFAASLCCITPVLALLAGTSGIASAFTWLEPFRTYFIGSTVAVLGIAWYQKLRPVKSNETDCDCGPDQKQPFLQTKLFMGIVTIFAGLMLAFPLYANIFYPDTNRRIISSEISADTTTQVALKVKGMTCASCEYHIEHAVAQLPGVKYVKASYREGSTIVHFVPDVTQETRIAAAITQLGYKVIDAQKSLDPMQINDMGNINFYQVPLVCNAAPTIGCGSRSKPVLLDLEATEIVEQAWLNRQGNVIAVVWDNEATFDQRRETISEIFGLHSLNTIELLEEEYQGTLVSFTESKNSWYRGTAVDALSREEAAILAERLLTEIKKEAKVTAEQEEDLMEKITNTFYDFFLNFETMDDLADPNAYKLLLAEIITYGNTLAGQEIMPGLDALWTVCAAGGSSCSHVHCSASCNHLQNKN